MQEIRKRLDKFSTVRLELSRIEFEINKLALGWWWQQCFISRVMAHNYTECMHCNLHRSGGGGGGGGLFV